MENSLPTGWVETTLNSICSINTGKWDANHATIGGKYRFYTCAYEYLFSDTKRFGGKCIILPGNGANVGQVFFYDGEFDVYQRTYVLSDFKVCAKYVYYHLKFFWKEVNKEKQYGSATNYIRIGNFTDYKIQIPPLAEQHRIVSKLDTIMQMIEYNNARLENVAQFEYKIFLRNLFDGSTFYESVKLGNYCEEQTKTIGIKWQNHRLIGVSKDEGVIDLRTGGKKTFEKYKIVKPGWFLYNPMRVDIGSIAIWDGNEIAITSPDYVVFSIKNSISPKILLKYLKSSYGLSEINNNTQGAVRSRLYYRNLANIDFPFSGLKNQYNAELLLTGFIKLSTRKRIIESIIDKLQRSILNKAFRGELAPQVLSDEPGGDLLKRILVKKEISIEGKNKRRQMLLKKKKV